MVQRGERLRFTGEARQPLVIRCEEIREDLDRNAAIELGIARAIHLAHATGSERRHDFIGPETGAD